MAGKIELGINFRAAQDLCKPKDDCLPFQYTVRFRARRPIQTYDECQAVNHQNLTTQIRD